MVLKRFTRERKLVKKFHIPLLFRIALIAIVLFGLFHLYFILTAIVLSLSALIEYIRLEKDLEYDFGHIFFLALIFTRLRAVHIGILFVLFASIMPRIFTGKIGETSFTIYPIQLVFIFLSHFFVGYDIVYVGVILTIICYMLIVLSSLALEMPLLEIMQEVLFGFVFNIVFFISFSEPFLVLLQRIVNGP